MIIGARFNGPPGSGNGGYSAGTFAAELGADRAADRTADRSGAEVTLRRPPPLDTPLEIRPLDNDAPKNGTLGAFYGAELIASGFATTVDADPVDAVAATDAHAATQHYYGFTSHPFPTCYVCGPLREDGLRIFPGRVAADRTAAPFLVPDEVSPAVLWAALDCPGGWAVPLEDRPYVLGRMAARIDALPAPGVECVVVGQLIGEDGRKAYVRSSLYGPGGEMLATAEATWIALSAS